MKFAQVAEGTRATTLVKFRRANAPLPPPLTAEQVEAGVSAVPDPGLCECAVRVLTDGEQGQIFVAAIKDAAEQGVTVWDKDHPICRLAQMRHTVFLACVDPDAPDPNAPSARFFDSVEQIKNARELGSDNVAILYEAQDDWQQTCTFGRRDKKLSLDEMFSIMQKEAERPENSAEATPYDALPRGMQKQLVRSISVLFLGSLTGKSSIGSSSSTVTTPGSSESKPPSQAAASRTGRARSRKGSPS